MGRSSTVKFFIALVLIVSNSTAVLYFARDKFLLPQFMAGPISFLADIFDKEKLSTPTVNTEALEFPNEERANNDLNHKAPQTYTRKQKISNHDELPALHSMCSDKRPQANNKQIYSWIDSMGIQHLSDTPRLIESDTPFTVVGAIQAEAVSINYSGVMPPFNVQERIRARVFANNKLFEKITPKELIKPVIINFRTFDDRKRYDAYQKKIAPSLKPSNGFYVSSMNESVVLMNNGESSINTAVHEAMHAINRHWFGHMSKWLNEGIAEYAEASHSKKALHSGWKQYLSQIEAIALSELFVASESTWKAQSSKMYSTSWAYVAFLMDTSPQTLSRYLLEESNNGCKSLSIADIERISAKPLKSIQRQFNKWLHRI